MLLKLNRCKDLPHNPNMIADIYIIDTLILYEKMKNTPTFLKRSRNQIFKDLKYVRS